MGRLLLTSPSPFRFKGKMPQFNCLALLSRRINLSCEGRIPLQCARCTWGLTQIGKMVGP